MKYTTVVTFYRFNVKTLREELITLDLSEGTATRLVSNLYSLTNSGWDTDANFEISIGNGVNQISGRWCLYSVLKIPK